MLRVVGEAWRRRDHEQPARVSQDANAFSGEGDGLRDRAQRLRVEEADGGEGPALDALHPHRLGTSFVKSKRRATTGLPGGLPCTSMHTTRATYVRLGR